VLDLQQVEAAGAALDHERAVAVAASRGVDGRPHNHPLGALSGMSPYGFAPSTRSPRARCRRRVRMRTASLPAPGSVSAIAPSARASGRQHGEEALALLGVAMLAAPPPSPGPGSECDAAVPVRSSSACRSARGGRHAAAPPDSVALALAQHPAHGPPWRAQIR
jgi:hypothetical protein